MQTTLLGLAFAFILALIAALVGPYFIDWNQFRPQFEAEATRIVGAPVRVGGKLDARLLPAPSLSLRSVVVGGANDVGKVHADKLDVEFSLGSLMRGEWRATELTVNGVALDLGLDPKGRVDWPASQGTFNLASLAIDRLNLTGRVALHDAASRSTLEINDIAFSGDVRSLAGALRGDGNFMVDGVRYPFRVSSGPSADGTGTRVRLNLDPGQRALSADLEGVVTFEARAPRFEGVVTLAALPAQSGKGSDPQQPWRVATRVKADHSAAQFDQIELTYGAEERSLKLTGSGGLQFGAAPSLRASLSARQLDADKFAAKDNAAAEPLRVVPVLRALLSGMPQPPIPAQIELVSEQVTLGGRPLQDITAELRGNGKSWTVHRLEFRAPGATKVSLSGASMQGAAADRFKANLNVESAEPDTLLSWLQGRSDGTYRSQKPLRLRGDVAVAPGGFAIEAMKAEIDGGAVEGRIAVTQRAENTPSRVDAEFKAERLDLDAAAAFVRSLAGPQAEWPDQAGLSLDIGRAISAGQELRPLVAKLGYNAQAFSLDRLTVGQSDNVAMDGAGSFDRVNATGKLALNVNAASLSRLSAVIAPISPLVAARLDALGTSAGPARLKLALDLDKAAGETDRSSARAVLDIDAPQLKGGVTFTAKVPAPALRGIDIEALGRTDVSAETRLASPQGRNLVALFGLDHVIRAGEGAAQFEGTASGAWRAPVRLKAKVWGAGLDADAEGSVEPWATESKTSVNLRVRSADVSPLLDVKSSAGVLDLRLSSRVALTGSRLSFDDLDTIIAGSRLRGRLALTLGEKKVEGEIGLDQITLAPVFAAAIGANGRDPAEPLRSGLLGEWRGSVAFQALRGELPGGAELQPVSGTVKSDGQALIFDAVKGKIGGGEFTATIDARPSPNGLAFNATVQLANVDGSALRYRNLTMPQGRASLQMTLLSLGRSAAALTGSLSGSGTVTLESARIDGLDPRAFDVAIRASDSGQVNDDTKLRQIVEPVLAGGGLPIASAQIPFNIREGRIRVGATTLTAGTANAIVSGGYDIPADQADIRAALTSSIGATGSSRPEIQFFAAGTPDAMSRTVDVTALSSWLAVRTIDRETRRLDAIERGESPMPATVAPPANRPEPTPDAGAPAADVPVPARDPRRLPPKPRVSVPHPMVVPAAPVALPPSAAPTLAADPQVAPLPPPIEIKPAPKPRPRPPLALTPQVANPPPRPALQNSN